MEDLTRNYTKPCIMDIKQMGRKTWVKEATATSGPKTQPPPPRARWAVEVKDATTTSGTLGYRVAGMQVQDSSTGAMWRADRKFAQQTSFHFFSASILLIYEANTAEHEGAEAKEEGKEAGRGAAHPPSLRLVDFAHAIDAQGKVDENFLQAIDGVMAAWKGVLGE
ncbi:unnamed protein product [Closterium sp. Naga37s-1]|nr:unnamed protein product [Closterium sp. Naga37s-1]